MKRCASVSEDLKRLKNDSTDNEYKTEEEKIQYIVWDQPVLNNCSVKMIVKVRDNNIFTTRINLIEGDENLFKKAEHDILRFLLRKYKMLVVNSLHEIYVLI